MDETEAISFHSRSHHEELAVVVEGKAVDGGREVREGAERG